MTRYCKCFDYACRYNLCAKTLRVSDLEMLDEATGERIFSVYCEHGTGFAKGNVREKDIVFTDSQGRETGGNRTATERPPSLAPLFDGSTGFARCNDEDKLLMGLRYLTDFVKECIAAKERRMFGCPLFIRTVQEIADTSGSSIRPAETQLAENAWASFSNALRVALMLFSKDGLFDAKPFISWLKDNTSVTCAVGRLDFYRGISGDVLNALKEKCRETAIKRHPDYEEEIEMLFCGVADGMDGLPYFLPLAETGAKPTVKDPEQEYTATQSNDNGLPHPGAVSATSDIMSKLDEISGQISNAQAITVKTINKRANATDALIRKAWKDPDMAKDKRTPLQRKWIDKAVYLFILRHDMEGNEEASLLWCCTKYWSEAQGQFDNDKQFYNFANYDYKNYYDIPAVIGQIKSGSITVP